MKPKIEISLFHPRNINIVLREIYKYPNKISLFCLEDLRDNKDDFPDIPVVTYITIGFNMSLYDELIQNNEIEITITGSPKLIDCDIVGISNPDQLPESDLLRENIIIILDDFNPIDPYEKLGLSSNCVKYSDINSYPDNDYYVCHNINIFILSVGFCQKYIFVPLQILPVCKSIVKKYNRVISENC